MRISAQARTARIELSEQMPCSLVDSRDRPNVNRDAFNVFYSRTSRPLWAYLVRICGRHDVADDLLQESYYRFLAATVPEMDSTESKSYLFRIATNLLRDRWRRAEPPDFGNTAEQSCEDDPETRTDVRRAFDRLKPRERQLLWLAHVEGFDHKEIARMTGLRVASVRVLLFRARRELAGALRERSQIGKQGVDV
jgi:RNA polymerase sigma-70 factor (ECF subfamily)